MNNKVIQVAADRGVIMSGPPIHCPCGEKWYSPFDKLFVSAYDKCSTCCSEEELESLSENIFAIL